MSFFLIVHDCKHSWIVLVINCAWWCFLLLWTVNVTEMFLQNKNIIQLWDIFWRQKWERSSYYWDRVCYVFTGSGCEFVSLSVSVWLFQMLKWIISQKLLNVQWKVVTGTPVSDLQLFFFFYWPEFYVLVQQVSNSQPKWTFFAAQISLFFLLLSHLKKDMAAFQNPCEQSSLSNEVFTSQSSFPHLCLLNITLICSVSVLQRFCDTNYRTQTEHCRFSARLYILIV